MFLYPTPSLLNQNLHGHLYFNISREFENTGLDLALVIHKQNNAEIIYCIYNATLNFLNRK